nr:membrane spanning protein [Kibdelosporangium sp. MJ126-NF4]
MAIAVPAVVKAVCGAVLAVLVVMVWQQFADLKQQQELTAPWEKVQDYAIFYPRLVGDDRQELETGGNASSVTEARDLYPLLDKAGALFIDAANYEPGVQDPTGRWPVPPIRVNTNYLKQYPILDDSRKPIDIEDDEQAWVVAVPEQLKARETHIRELLRETRTGGKEITGAVEAEERIAGARPPARFANQDVRIMWMARGQRVFSFDPKVDPQHGNLITDPIVEIMTPANSLTVDRLNSITGGLNTGLKVRVDEDPAVVLRTLAPTLKELKLDDNLRHLVRMHEAMATQVNDVRRAITQATAFAGAALLVMVALNATIVLIGFDRLRRKLAVRRLHGVGFPRSYREILLTLGGTWLGQTLLAVLALVVLAMNTVSPRGDQASRFAQIPALAAVAVASLVVEALLVVVTARIVERRNAIKRLKEL